MRRKTHLRQIMCGHPSHSLHVDLDGLLVLAIIRVEASQVEEGRDLGGLMGSGVFEARPVQLRTLSVHLNGLFFSTQQT